MSHFSRNFPGSWRFYCPRCKAELFAEEAGPVTCDDCHTALLTKLDDEISWTEPFELHCEVRP